MLRPTKMCQYHSRLRIDPCSLFYTRQVIAIAIVEYMCIYLQINIYFPTALSHIQITHSVIAHYKTGFLTVLGNYGNLMT